MEIKSYNRAVDPNVENANAQATNNIEAFGGNTTGNQLMGKAVGALQGQIQAYVDDQISMKVLDATNEYKKRVNDLLNDPDSGLLHKQDTNALDILKQYQEGEAKIRRETIASLPNYEKAHRAFNAMADENNLTKTGAVMQDQYEKTTAHRNESVARAVADVTDTAMETNTLENAYSSLTQIRGIVYSQYKNIYGDEKLDEMTKNAATTFVQQWVYNKIKSGDESDYEDAYSLMDKVSPFVYDAAITKLKTELNVRKREHDMMDIAKESFNLFPNDPKKREEHIRSKMTYTVEEGGGGKTGDTTLEMIAAVENDANDYNLGVDGSGPIGRYQFLPDTYEEEAKKIGIDPSDKSPEAQDKVAAQYKKTLAEAMGSNDEDALIIAWNFGPAAGRAWLDKKDGFTFIDGNFYTWDQAPPQNASVNDRLAKAHAAKEKIKASGSNIQNAINQGVQWTGSAPLANGKVACVEAACSIGAAYSPWLKKLHDENVVNVDVLVDKAKAEPGVSVIPYDPSKVKPGSIIVYDNLDGTPQFHVMIAEEGGKVVGNMSSANNGEGGVAEASNADFDPQHLKPTQIIIPQEAENAKTTRTRVKYSEEEIQHMLKIADTYQTQATRNEEIANDGLIKAGLQEMQLAHENGTLTYESAIAITEKYGKGNPKVYAALKGAIGTYITPPRAAGGGSGGPGGGGRQGGRLDIWKSLIGSKFTSMNGFISYCVSSGITPTPAEQESMQKSIQDFNAGSGEWKPEFQITEERLAARTGIDKSEFSNQFDMVQRATAARAADFQAKNGRAPTEDEIYAIAAQLIYSDDTYGGRSEAAALQAGVSKIETAYDDNGQRMAHITFTDGGTMDVYPQYVQPLINGEKTRYDYEIGNYD